MIVFINDKEIVVFEGACIQDAILSYSPELWKQVFSNELYVIDRFGNQTEPDGPMMDGQHFELILNPDK